MKIVIAPDSFKESLSAIEVCNAIEKGLKKSLPDAQYIKVPVADGGEGSLDAISQSLSNSISIKTKVKAPLGDTITAKYLINNDTAVIELAECCGLNIYTPQTRNPMLATSFGFGQLIKDALDKGIRKFILTLGGSGTNDAGLGLLQALGVKFLNKHNECIKEVNLTNISDIASIDTSSLDKRILDSNFKIACDVNNPLCGKNGATFIFGKQKGLGEDQLQDIDSKIQDFANICKKLTNQDTQHIAGTGAAGGLGFALVTFLNAELISGAELILDFINFDNLLDDANVVVVGEGKMDYQSLCGKIPVAVAQRAKKQNVKKVIAIVGSYSLNDNEFDESPIDAVFSCIPYYTDLHSILNNGAKNVEQTTTNIAKLLTF